jgi:2-C-methyl-D-erythritol 4-phosphate cytidylyltransferase
MVYSKFMFDGKWIGAVLLMGGNGRRFGGDVPKQFHLLQGREVYRHALDTLISVRLFDEIVLVCHPDWMDITYHGVKVIAGGSTRQQSSYLGLQALDKRTDIVLIHDAVRPFVTEEILRNNIIGAIQWGAVDTCVPSADTLVHAPGGQMIASIPKREEFLRGQTPQTFKMDRILEAHRQALSRGIENASDDCRLVLQMGADVHIVPGEEANFKITSEYDLLLANLSKKNIVIPCEYDTL